MLKHELGIVQPSFTRAFLKVNKLLALRICKPILLHSEIAYGKNKYLKKICSTILWF